MKFLELYFRKTFTVDLRALAVMRIWLAGIVLIDLGIRATDLEAHYSNMGVLPMYVLHQFLWFPQLFSLHALNGMWQFQAVLFMVAAVFAVFMLVGYRTRLATIASWVLLLSVQNRNPLIGQGGDDLLRMLLFWGIFLPWGAFYSYDAVKKQQPDLQENTSYFSAATVAYIMQIALVYFSTAMLKNSPEWHTDGTALYYALSLDQILMPGGRLIYPYPELLRFLTLTTYYTELILPFLLLIPVYNNFFRMVVVLVLLGFHIGISLTLFVGLFYLINIASITGLLPGPVMDWIDRKLLRVFRKPYTKEFREIFARITRQPKILSFQVSLHQPIIEKNNRRYIRNVLVAGMLLYCIWWNLGTTHLPVPKMPEGSKWFGYMFRLNQHWGMFSPIVFRDDGWYILEGKTEQGTLVDLNQQGGEINYTKPASVVSLFKNDRWRKYSENYLFVKNGYMRPYYCHYMMRIWNESHPGKPINQLEVIYMKEPSLPDYQVSVPTREVLCSCALAAE